MEIIIKGFKMPAHTAKHYGRSHRLTLKPKPAIVLGYFATKILPTQKN
jgi:hypothetical protein